MGRLSFIYLDDGLGSQPDQVSAAAAGIIQRKEIGASGQVLCNDEKLYCALMQVGQWLGFVINTMAMNYFLPDKKVSKLKRPLEVAI